MAMVRVVAPDSLVEPTAVFSTIEFQKKKCSNMQSYQ